MMNHQNQQILPTSTGCYWEGDETWNDQLYGKGMKRNTTFRLMTCMNCMWLGSWRKLWTTDEATWVPKPRTRNKLTSSLAWQTTEVLEEVLTYPEPTEQNPSKPGNKHLTSDTLLTPWGQETTEKERKRINKGTKRRKWVWREVVQYHISWCESAYIGVTYVHGTKKGCKYMYIHVYQTTLSTTSTVSVKVYNMHATN